MPIDNKYYVATYADIRGRYRHALGEKNKGDTAVNFLFDRGYKSISKNPSKDFDSESYYAPLISNEFTLKDISKSVPSKEESFATKENLASYLRASGWIVYKKKKEL